MREAAAKNKLKSLGLSQLSLITLSNKNGFSYLKSILSLKGSKLEFDPMNQKASCLCFSEKTESGLASMGDEEGSKLCNLLRTGIIEALDMTGISSEERLRNIFRLKSFLDEKIDPVKRLKRPGNENMSNELLQMIHCSLDSHIVTFLNMSHFNARRKSTLTCEQFFGMMTLMADGGRKLDCRVISDILERSMISNALRMTSESVKGFKFLSKLKVHMTSYAATDSEEVKQTKLGYPNLTKQKNVLIPYDSPQDHHSSKRRRLFAIQKTDAVKEALTSSSSNVRKYHRKF